MITNLCPRDRALRLVKGLEDFGVHPFPPPGCWTKPPDSLYLLSPGGVATDDFYPWRPLSLDEPSGYGAARGGDRRIVAAARLYHHYDIKKIVTTSRMWYGEGTGNCKPHHYAMQAAALMLHGVKTKDIHYEVESIDTVTEIAEIVKLASQFVLGEAVTVILTNAYHCPRVETQLRLILRYCGVGEPLSDDQKSMIDTLLCKPDRGYKSLLTNSAQAFLAGQYISTTGHRFLIVAAEDVLMANNPLHRTSFNGSYRSEGMREEVANEMRGIEMLEAGTYGRR